MMKKLILCLAMMLFSTSAAYAAEQGITVEADYGDYSITLKGFAGAEYSGENVNIEIIYPLGENVNEIPPITAENFREKTALFSYTTVKEDGSFEYRFKLNGMAKIENPFWARVSVDGADAEHENLKFVTGFAYTSKNEIDKKLGELKDGVKADTLEADMELLGIALPNVWSQFDQTQKTYAEGLINAEIKKLGELTTELVKNNVRGGIFMTAAKDANNANQLKEFMTDSELAEYFGLALTNPYYTEQKNEQTVFDRMYQSTSSISKKEDTAKLFLESLFLETISNIDHKSKAGTILKDFSEILSEENRNALAQLSAERLDRVCAAVVSAAKSDFDTMTRFNQMLAGAIKKSADSSQGNNGRGSGNSGSGSKSGNSGQQIVTYPTKQDETVTEPDRFTDIENVSWAKEAIESLYDQQIVSGMEDGKFYPNKEITREEVVTLLCKAFGIKESDQKGRFEDVYDRWSAGFVNAAFENEIVKGITETYFGAEQNVTREDMAVMAGRAGKISASKQAEFTDSSEISAYAKDAVAALSGQGVISGYADGSFRPRNNITRAEAAVMIYRLIHLK